MPRIDIIYRVIGYRNEAHKNYFNGDEKFENWLKVNNRFITHLYKYDIFHKKYVLNSLYI